MNIAIIVQSLTGGGAERAAANLSEDLSGEFNVKVIVFDAKEISYPYGGELINLNLAPRKSILGKIVNTFLRIKAVRKIKKDNDIKCSISFMPGANLVNSLTYNKDVVISSQRNMMSIKYKSSISRMMIKQISKLSDSTVSLSQGVKQDLVDEFKLNPTNIVTIYNSVSKKWFKRSSNEAKQIVDSFDPNYKYIVSVGRLTHQKGQWHLIKALKNVLKKNRNVKLLILGEGKLKKDLKDLAEKMGVAEHVHFLGYIKDHHEILEKCNVFVFPSLFEGLGNALLEAMACGLPVIATDCESGPREIIAPETDILSKANEIEYAENGVLVPRFNTKPSNIIDTEVSEKETILAEAISNVLNNEELSKHYSDKSKERIKDFHPEVIKNQWIELIYKLELLK